MVVNSQTETFQLLCPRFVFDSAETQSYEGWCRDKGVTEPAIISADLHPLDPSIKELYFPRRTPPEPIWKKQIHNNPFLGWKIKSETPKVNINLCSTIDHLNLHHIIINKNVDEIIKKLEQANFCNNKYQFIVKKDDREFENLIQTLYQKIQAIRDGEQFSEIIELLITRTPTTFLRLWEYSNQRRKEIQGYMYP